MSDKTFITERIKALFLEAGFYAVGITDANRLDDEAERLKEWIGLGFHGKMQYMENHFEKRVHPERLVEGTQSIICLAYNYYTEDTQIESAPQLASYAYGRDYHKVIKKRVKPIIQQLQQEFGHFNSRTFVDSAPVMERDLAKKAGLGWIGKNTLLINPKKGSKFFLAEVFVDLDLAYDTAISDHCGTCTRCIDACPTEAIHSDGYVMDASKCISYLTIELKDEDLPPEFKGKMNNWMFGCDICQDVCPWNRFSAPHSESEFQARERILTMSREDWLNLDEDSFNELFHGSAVKRAGFKQLKRNILYLLPE